MSETHPSWEENHPWWTHPSVTSVTSSQMVLSEVMGNPHSSSIYRIYGWIFHEINHPAFLGIPPFLDWEFPWNEPSSVFGVPLWVHPWLVGNPQSSPVGRRDENQGLPYTKPWGPSAHTCGQRPEILREQMNNQYVIIYQYTISIRGSNQRCWNITACIRNENHM